MKELTPEQMEAAQKKRAETAGTTDPEEKAAEEAGLVEKSAPYEDVHDKDDVLDRKYPYPKDDN